jgi:hypothetical protein
MSVFSWCFYQNFCYALAIIALYMPCPSHLRDLTIIIIFGEECNLRNSSRTFLNFLLRSYQIQVFSAPCSRTPCLCSPHKLHTHTEPQAKPQFCAFKKQAEVTNTARALVLRPGCHYFPCLACLTMPLGCDFKRLERNQL